MQNHHLFGKLHTCVRFNIRATCLRCCAKTEIQRNPHTGTESRLGEEERSTENFRIFKAQLIFYHVILKLRVWEGWGSVCFQSVIGVKKFCSCNGKWDKWNLFHLSVRRHMLRLLWSGKLMTSENSSHSAKRMTPFLMAAWHSGRVICRPHLIMWIEQFEKCLKAV